MSYRLSLAVVGGLLVVGLSCDAPTAPDTGTLVVNVPALGSSVTLSGIRVTAIDPNGQSISRTATPGAAIRFTHMDPGAYRVAVEGLVDGQTAYFGQAPGLTVTRGHETAATISVQRFQTDVATSAVHDTARVKHFGVFLSRVSGATHYILSWSRSPDMSDAVVMTLTDTTTELQVDREGKYYVTARAANDLVPGGGIASAAIGVLVVQQVAKVTVTPASPSVALGATKQMTAVAYDASNAKITSAKFIWLSSDPNVAIVSTSGLVTSRGAGTTSITAAAQGIPGGTALTVTGPVLSRLAFIVQPVDIKAGDGVPTAIQVEVRDVNNKRVANATNPITLGFNTNPSSGSILGTKTVNAVGGVAVFSGISVDKVGAGYRLSAASAGLTTAVSGTFNVTGGAPAGVHFTTEPPANITANEPIADIVVKLVDKFGNITTGTNAVTLSIANNPWASSSSPGGSLLGDASVDAVDGVATFSGMKLNQPAAGYTLKAKGSGLTSELSSAVNANVNWSQVAVGAAHACARTGPSGNVYCWGYDGYGELASIPGLTYTDSVPHITRGGYQYIQVVSGDNHSCGLRVNGSVLCWGNNDHGQLGIGNTLNVNFPSIVGGGSLLFGFASIAAGGNVTCGITAGTVPNHQVYCWGEGTNGEMGNGANDAVNSSPVHVSEPLQTTTVATQITVGAYHVCASGDNGKTYCWGANGNGQLDAGDNSDRNVPTEATDADGASGLSAGASHTCGILSGTLICWGSGGNGQLGDGNGSESWTPVTVAGGLTFTSVSAGDSFTCGIAGGQAYCWGKGNVGQIGNGSTADQLSPVLVDIGVSFNSVSASRTGACGISAGLDMFCWGQNDIGQLGVGWTDVIGNYWETEPWLVIGTVPE